MRHGSLESGIGGFDYAAQMLGWENVFHCEINTFCQTVLKYYWPHAQSFTDIFEFDGKPWRGKVEIISAGFPCQPFSHAGKRKGSTDDRFIWPENMRIFREIKPRFIVAENVPGLLTIENGMVFETVCSDLENEGYEVQAFIIPACAKDAVHRRDRVWIVAHNNGIGEKQRESEIGNIRNEYRNGFENDSNDKSYDKWPAWLQQERSQKQIGGCYSNGIIADTFSAGLQRNEQWQASGKRKRASRPATEQFENENWLEAATRLCGVDDEFAGRLDVAAISKSKWRTESLKAYGNAIYWPIAFEIFKAIEET